VVRVALRDPRGGASGASQLWGPGSGLVGGAAGFVFVLVATIVGVVVGVVWSERRAVEQVRREGMRCVAPVKS